MRKPITENKYHLKPKDIEKAIILDTKAIHKKPFWRNNVINAWCLSGGVAKGYSGEYEDTYWMGFYDVDAKSYAGKIKLDCSSYEGMCNYTFKKFYDENEIENEIDLQLQEKLLAQINWLLDEKIITIPNKNS